MKSARRSPGPRALKPRWKAPKPKTLFTRPGVSPQRMLAGRFVLVAGLFLAIFLLLWFDRDGLVDQVKREQLSITDVIYFTMVTVATVGYGDIVPVTDRARLIDALFIVPIRIIIWLIFFGTAYQLVVQRVIEEFRMKRLQTALNDHLIVCGFGLSGSIAAQELLQSGYLPAQIIVIDADPTRLEAAAAIGLTGLLGDPTREDMLQQAQVARARAVIVTVRDDSAAVLLTLTVRSLSDTAKVIVRIQEQIYQPQLRQAGADVIISSSRIGALLLADAVESKYIVPFVNDLLTVRGRVSLVERRAEPAEVGQLTNMLGTVLVVGLERQGKLRSFLDEPHCAIEAGDLLLVVESNRPRRKTVFT
jgi:voltage-gated potassium channel